MRLSHVSIENFRGIRRLAMDLDAVTVVIGENNHGKTSVFDVLGLCLGRRGASPESRFRRDDFYRHDNGDVGSIRIVLTFGDEGRAGRETAPVDAFATARAEGRGGVGQVRAEYRGAPADGRIERRFIDAEGSALDPQPSPDLFEQLHALHPVLLMRFAQPHGQARLSHVAADGPDTVERRGRRNLEALIGRVYNDLAHKRGPLPTDEITRALEAARHLYGSDDSEVSGDGAMSRMLNELLADPGRLGQTQGTLGPGRTGSGSQTVGLLLVVGAMLDVLGREGLPNDARPIIAIEEPETHLHPILLATTWDVIEGLGAQTVVTTNSGELLASVPMRYLRRLVRGDTRIEAHGLREHTLTESDLRRVRYHIRAKRGGVLFSRCWLLVEGESEFWLLTQLAHVLGYDLDAEGVRCVEFAQCGIAPLVKLANDLGIEWHMLTDGDESGGVYAHEAGEHLGGKPQARRVTLLEKRDVERCLWHHGFDDVYRDAARGPRSHRRKGRGGRKRSSGRERSMPPGRVIAKAVRKKSKPYLALLVAEASAERGPDSVPPVLRHVIETAVSLAREAVTEG